MRISRYGKEGCEHEWRYCIDHWVEECVPAVCVRCGAMGCMCDVIESCGGWDMRPSAGIFFGEAQTKGANTNGRWVNPYVKTEVILDLKKQYIIERITDREGNPRTDGKYPLRVGRKVQFIHEPKIGACLWLAYCPKEDNDYDGCLKTSTVEASQYTITGGEIVVTLNSVYYFEPVG